MQWIPLPACQQQSLGRGAVFRFPAQHPFEAIVDFMIIEEPHADTGYKLICSTGHHAGQTELIFPEEAGSQSSGISVSWLKENWEKWIYPHCSASDVMMMENYPPAFGR